MIGPSLVNIGIGVLITLWGLKESNFKDPKMFFAGVPNYLGALILWIIYG